MDLDDNEIQDCSIEFQGDSLHGVYTEHPRQNTEDEIPEDRRAYRGAVVLMADSYDLLEDRVRSLELYVQSHDAAIQNMDACLERDTREIIEINRRYRTTRDEVKETSKSVHCLELQVALSLCGASIAVIMAICSVIA